MYGFLLKKNFCDGWDNLLSVIITNVIFMFVGLGIIALNAVTAQNTILLVLAFILSFIIVSIVVFAYGDSAAAIADFKGIHYADFFKAIPLNVCCNHNDFRLFYPLLF